MTQQEFNNLTPDIASEIKIDEVVYTILFMETEVETIWKTYKYEFYAEEPWNNIEIDVFNGTAEDIALYLEANKMRI